MKHLPSPWSTSHRTPRPTTGRDLAAAREQAGTYFDALSERARRLAALMRLSWNEIRARAADFAREWADLTERVESSQRSGRPGGTRATKRDAQGGSRTISGERL